MITLRVMTFDESSLEAKTSPDNTIVFNRMPKSERIHHALFHAIKVLPWGDEFDVLANFDVDSPLVSMATEFNGGQPFTTAEELKNAFKMFTSLFAE